MASHKQIGHWINGAMHAGSDSAKQAVFDPARGIVASEVALGSAETVDLAVTGALRAFKEWANTPPIKRARVLFQFKTGSRHIAMSSPWPSPPNTERR